MIDPMSIAIWKRLIEKTVSLYESGTCEKCGHPWADHFRKCEPGSCDPESSGCQHDACRCFYVPHNSRYEEEERVAMALRDLERDARTAIPALLAEREELLALLCEAEWAACDLSDDDPKPRNMCPECGARRERGHALGCRLAALLKNAQPMGSPRDSADAEPLGRSGSVSQKQSP